MTTGVFPSLLKSCTVKFGLPELVRPHSSPREVT